MNIFDKSHKAENAIPDNTPASAQNAISEQGSVENDRNAILADIAAYAISDTQIARLFDDDALRARKNPGQMTRTTLYLDDESIKNADWVSEQYDGATRSSAIRILICLGRQMIEHILEHKGAVPK